jgi:hypothetical protein
MKSRRIRSILKFADNVDVIEDGDGTDDGNVKKRKINKKRNKKTIKAKKTKRSKRQAVGDKGRDTRTDEEDKEESTMKKIGMPRSPNIPGGFPAHGAAGL